MTKWYYGKLLYTFWSVKIDKERYDRVIYFTYSVKLTIYNTYKKAYADELEKFSCKIIPLIP